MFCDWNTGIFGFGADWSTHINMEFCCFFFTNCPNNDKLSMFQVPHFRCVESEEGVKLADYANYSIPLDIQHLVAGEDPYKFMDLMKMVIYFFALCIKDIFVLIVVCTKVLYHGIRGAKTSQNKHFNFIKSYWQFCKLKTILTGSAFTQRSFQSLSLN